LEQFYYYRVRAHNNGGNHLTRMWLVRPRLVIHRAKRRLQTPTPTPLHTYSTPTPTPSLRQMRHWTCCYSNRLYNGPIGLELNTIQDWDLRLMEHSLDNVTFTQFGSVQAATRHILVRGSLQITLTFFRVLYLMVTRITQIPRKGLLRCVRLLPPTPTLLYPHTNPTPQLQVQQ